MEDTVNTVVVNLTRSQIENLLFYYDRVRAEACGHREFSLQVESVLKNALSQAYEQR